MRTIFPTALVLVSVFSLEACMPRELPPAAPPARVVPDVPPLPAESPDADEGRVLLDAVQEPAVVSLVTPPAPIGPGRAWGAEASSPPPPSPEAANVPRDPFAPAKEPEGALLCVTPCAVDLPVGAHRLMFTSVDDASRTSVTTVGVSHGTTVVRHAMEETKPMRPAWLLGFAGAFVGAPMALGGAMMTGVGAAGGGESPSDARATAVTGGVALALGGALLAGGIVAMNKNRGSHRKGATTTFPVAARPL